MNDPDPIARRLGFEEEVRRMLISGVDRVEISRFLLEAFVVLSAQIHQAFQEAVFERHVKVVNERAAEVLLEELAGLEEPEARKKAGRIVQGMIARERIEVILNCQKIMNDFNLFVSEA